MLAAEQFGIVRTLLLHDGVQVRHLHALLDLAEDLRMTCSVGDILDVASEARDDLAVAGEVLEIGVLEDFEAMLRGLVRAVLRKAQVQVELGVLKFYLLIDEPPAIRVHLVITPVVLQAPPLLVVARGDAPAELLDRGATHLQHRPGHADVPGFHRLEVELGLGAVRRDLVPVVQQALVHGAAAGLHVPADIFDVVDALPIHDGRQLDVLRDLADDPRHLVLAAVHLQPVEVRLQASHHLARLMHLIPTKSVNLILARFVDAELQAPVVGAGLHVVLDLPPARRREVAVAHLVLQALQHLRVPGRDGLAVRPDRGDARAADQRLQRHVRGLELAVLDLRLPAILGQPRQALAEAQVDALWLRAAAVLVDVLPASLDQHGVRGPMQAVDLRNRLNRPLAR
mmetsp:Transcript_35676/g.107789  ORF Transcript_35676/g.107789 Transcript_35676/m.107789 type:complete len:399 (+) Transcript_35676:1136-2332(+)